ncbi:uncharacterized protein LOC132266978 [Cornus florida]|uniref:uncharacterized protein LOC132266978 n=1 Tax=Cornus florida TaxID=4283 RepID=UPI00289B8C3A|nr:uncharacterized protein LOC132266978 [Cornus florida]
MEELMNPFDKEYMKMAMLKHEETFKEQVYELHRLYRIQKILMRSIESNTRRIGVNRIDLERPADHEEHIAESDGINGVAEIEEESQIELTLGPASYYRRKKSETMLSHSESGWGFSSSSIGSSHVKRSSPRTHQMKDTSHNWGLVEVPDSYQISARGKSFDVEEQLRQDRVKQPWFFQSLSLNMA